jgi:hypothetical protein
VDLILIGGDSEKFNRFLESDDPCFGKRFSKSSPECKGCLCPVIVAGKLHTLNEVCAARSKGGAAPGACKNLMSSDVLRRLAEGCTIYDVFVEMVEGQPLETAAPVARALLYRRLRNIRSGHDLPLPELPTLEDLKTYARQHHEGNRD